MTFWVSPWDRPSCLPLAVRLIASQFVEPVQQLTESVPDGDGLPVLGGNLGLPGAEPARPDDHFRVRGAECPQPRYLVWLVRYQPQGRARQPTAAAVHWAVPSVVPVIFRAWRRSTANSTERSTAP